MVETRGPLVVMTNNNPKVQLDRQTDETRRSPKVCTAEARIITLTKCATHRPT